MQIFNLLRNKVLNNSKKSIQVNGLRASLSSGIKILKVLGLYIHIYTYITWRSR